MKTGSRGWVQNPCWRGERGQIIRLADPVSIAGRSLRGKAKDSAECGGQGHYFKANPGKVYLGLQSKSLLVSHPVAQ